MSGDEGGDDDDDAEEGESSRRSAKSHSSSSATGGERRTRAKVSDADDDVEDSVARMETPEINCKICIVFN